MQRGTVFEVPHLLASGSQVRLRRLRESVTGKSVIPSPLLSALRMVCLGTNWRPYTRIFRHWGVPFWLNPPFLAGFKRKPKGIQPSFPEFMDVYVF